MKSCKEFRLMSQAWDAEALAARETGGAREFFLKSALRLWRRIEALAWGEMPSLVSLASKRIALLSNEIRETQLAVRQGV